MKYFLFLILISISSIAHAQKGNYFLSNYAPAKDHSANMCFDIGQDHRGIMYFATKAGVLEFDGKNWDLLRRTAAVYSLQISPEGDRFWSGANGFGMIATDEQGFEYLKPVRDSLDADVIQTLLVNFHVYFLSANSIYILQPSTEKVKTVSSTPESGSFIKMFELYGSLYVQTENGKIFTIEDGKLGTSGFSLKGEIIFSARIEDDYIFGTSDNLIYACNQSLKPTQIKIGDQEYLDAGVLVNGSWVNRQLLALGTLRGGVVFLNPITGVTEEIVNYKTGLPDNEIFASISDKNQNVWVSHDYGYTRISPHLPFRSFSHYPGLEGNLLCSYSSSSSVYVGTTLGLYRLSKKDLYDELVYFVDVQIPDNQTETKIPETETAEEEKKPVVSPESKKRGIFGFLKRKSKKEKQEIPPSKTNMDTGGPREIESPPPPKFRKEKRTQKILRTSQYVFKKVENIDSKVISLVEVDGRLIASGLGGIFQVSGMKAKRLLEEPIHYLYASKTEKIIFASTYDDRVKTLVLEGNEWLSLDVLDLIDDQIDFIFEGNDRDLWICGIDKIYQYEITDYNILAVNTFDLSNSDAERTLGISWNNTIRFVNSEGFFRYDRKTNAIVRENAGVPMQYFAHNGNMIYRDEHGWKALGDLSNNSSFRLLNLFPDIRFITTDDRGENLWMITGENELFSFFAEGIKADHDVFPVFLKSISNQETKKTSSSFIEIVENKSAVKFEIVQPDYVNADAVEFRYQLRGMKEVWSEWSRQNSSIEFPYLPPGEYTLLVQGKNIFGKVTGLNPFTFKVLPPYWKRSWFYAMEFLLLASLVLLSFRLNARYRIVSRILSMLTIILLIQFIQTVFNSTLGFSSESPVLDFLLQVFIAILILPVEGYLRNLMFRSLDASGKFYTFVPAKNADPEKEKDLEHTGKVL